MTRSDGYRGRSRVHALVSAELAKPYYPNQGVVAKSKPVRSLAALEPTDKRAALIAICERLVWQAADPRACRYTEHTAELLVTVFGRAKLGWTAAEAAKLAALADQLGAEYWRLPIVQLVGVFEQVDITPALRASLGRLREHLAAADSVPHNRLAKRLAAL